MLILFPWLRTAKLFGKESEFVQYQCWATRQTGFCKADFSFLVWFCFVLIRKIHLFPEWSHYKNQKDCFFHFLLQKCATIPRHLLAVINIVSFSVSEWLTGIRYLEEIRSRKLQQNPLTEDAFMYGKLAVPSHAPKNKIP